MQLVTTNTELRKCFLAVLFVACENIRFSPLFAAGDVDVPQRETSPATKSEEKRETDDFAGCNVCLAYTLHAYYVYLPSC